MPELMPDLTLPAGWLPLAFALVMALSLLLIQKQIGTVTPPYTVLLLILAMVMVFAYNQFGVYRSNSSFTRKALTLFKAWSLTFGFLLLVGGFQAGEAC